MNLPSHPGTYALWLMIIERLTLRVGRLGELFLPPGYCVYVGSALGPGGLRARVAHHNRIAVRPHWHIDYLRRHTPLTEVWYSADSVRREHQWAELFQDLGGAAPLAGFGASDCDCLAHLFYFPHRLDWAWFVSRVQTLYPDHTPLRCASGLIDSGRSIETPDQSAYCQVEGAPVSEALIDALNPCVARVPALT